MLYEAGYVTSVSLFVLMLIKSYVFCAGRVSVIYISEKAPEILNVTVI